MLFRAGNKCYFILTPFDFFCKYKFRKYRRLYLFDMVKIILNSCIVYLFLLMGTNANKDRQGLILKFWFGELEPCWKDVPPEEISKRWWAKDEHTDEYIRRTFESDLMAAKEGELGSWEGTPEGTLALIVLLDQFSRNIYRGTPEAFSQDSLALAVSEGGIEQGFDKELHPVERIFFYLPFMHSEDLDIQKRSLSLFSDLEKTFTHPAELSDMLTSSREFAERHYEIIERFGRYPHRNEILGRQSTEEEIEFLKRPGSSF